MYKSLVCWLAVAVFHWTLSLQGASASPLTTRNATYHPIVVWHGLGDSAFSEPLNDFADELRNAFPGIYVRLVSLGEDFSSDQRAGFFGNVNEEVAQVCDALANDDKLRNGFDAIGFSQGGQFMRAYVQRCNKPAVRNLVTFGSQHMGISDLPACKPTEFLCRLAEGALRGGVYTDYAQSHIVTAQYYRDPISAERYQQYLDTNVFLTDINNELTQNETYKDNLLSLDNLVLLMFDHDATVQPKQSSWFASYPVPGEDDQKDDDKKPEVLPLRQSIIYKEDRLGLRKLDNRGALIMDACKGRHMQIDQACSSKVFGRYVGIAPPTKLIPTSVRHTWAHIVYSITGVRLSAAPTGAQTLMSAGLVMLLAAQLLLLGAVVASLAAMCVRGIAAFVRSRSKGSIRLV